MALTQLLVESSTHVSITLEKPTSLPPTVIETSVVVLLSADSWLLITLVVAPEQATKVKLAGAFALAHSCGYALVLRSQDRWSRGAPRPTPDEYQSPSGDVVDRGLCAGRYRTREHGRSGCDDDGEKEAGMTGNAASALQLRAAIVYL